jgi:hypothetical protein
MNTNDIHQEALVTLEMCVKKMSEKLKKGFHPDHLGTMA